MGGGSSKVEIMRKIINETSMKVMVKNSLSTISTTVQNNDITIAGNVGGTISDIEQSNKSRISVTALIDSSVSGKLQSDLIAAISESVKQKLPSIGRADLSTKVDSYVRSSVEATITQEALTDIKNQVAQSNSIKILGNDKTSVYYITQSNESKKVVDLVSKLSSDIIARAQTKAELSTNVEQTQAPVIGDFGGILVIVGIIAAIIGGIALAVYFKNNKWIVGLVVLVILAIIITIVVLYVKYKKDEEKEKNKGKSGFVGRRLIRINRKTGTAVPVISIRGNSAQRIPIRTGDRRFRGPNRSGLNRNGGVAAPAKKYPNISVAYI